MKFNYECLNCNINQVLKTTSLLEINENVKEVIVRKVLLYLGQVDYNKSNPEILKGTYKIITTELQVSDPYYSLKILYNRAALDLASRVKEIIEESNNSLNTALKMAIVGNLIDFASGHFVDENILQEAIELVDKKSLKIDHSQELFLDLNKKKTLLYLGDNCGEIVFDKIFISYLKKVNPQLEVTYAVRGQAIINDVTLNDSRMVKMEEVAKVISNGDGASGTVLKDTSLEFQSHFAKADVIIAKGQGNFESLSESLNDNIYFLLMAKCDLVAKVLNIEKGSIVCIKS